MVDNVGDINLDSDLNPDIELRVTFDWLKKWRKVTELTIILVCTYNIFGPTMFFGMKIMSYDVGYTFGLGLGLCFVSAIVGTFVGVILALFPVKGLPYYLKLPLATLSGILLTNLVLALLATYQLLDWARDSSVSLF